MSKKIRTEWDLSLFYKDINDPNIKKDLDKSFRLYSVFEKKYKKNLSYLRDPKALQTALEDCEKLWDNNVYKPYLYLFYYNDIHSDNEKVRSELNLVHQRITTITNKAAFFTINISKIDKKTQKFFLSHKNLKKYKYHLEKIFRSGKHNLTEAEERVLSLKNIVSRDMWIDTTEKMLGGVSVEYKGQTYPISATNSLIAQTKSQKERLEIHNKVYAELDKISEYATAEMNAIITDKKIEDELRAYKTPYEETILSYENKQKTVDNIVKVVNDSVEIPHRFFRLKAKMLGVKKLYYPDRLAEVGKLKKQYSFHDSYNTLYQVFSKNEPKWAEILEDMVLKGQLDVFPRKNKRSGAYSSGQSGNPTMVLLNHTDDYHSLETFAHEMGHSIHTKLSDKNSPFYRGYTISTAEVASTLMESFVFYHEFPKMSDKEKITALHDRISNSISTIWRQIGIFNFELSLHEEIRKKGFLSRREICELMVKNHKHILGDVFHIKDMDGLSFVNWMHIRRFFYVYTYATGELISRAIYEKYQQDKTYIKKINEFMSMGCLKSPEDIFKSIGIDITKPDFFLKGIKNIENDLNTLEELVKKG